MSHRWRPLPNWWSYPGAGARRWRAALRRERNAPWPSRTHWSSGDSHDRSRRALQDLEQGGFLVLAYPTFIHHKSLQEKCPTGMFEEISIVGLAPPIPWVTYTLYFSASAEYAPGSSHPPS